MKSVLISIQPKWCYLIAHGEKTLEVRESKPKLETPFKVYIYCTKDKNGWFDFGKKERLDGKVIGEFVCDSIRAFDVPYPAFQREMDKAILDESCLTYYQLHRYAYHDKLYAWHISNLKIFNKPKPLSLFHKVGYTNTKESVFGWTVEEEKSWQINRPPQSWCYVEELP